MQLWSRACTTFNNNSDEPTVVYVQCPMWQWTGAVTKDSTGLGTTNHATVFTQIEVGDPVHHPETLDAVWNLQLDPDFGLAGVYGPTLLSIHGNGVDWNGQRHIGATRYVEIG